MAVPKHRVGVIAGGIERELFSVRIGRRGDLTIIRKASSHIEIEGQRSAIIRERVSVHPSPQSDPKASTIKVTMDLEDGRHVEVAQLRFVGEDGFLTVAFGALCTDLRADHYTMAPKPRNEKTILFPFDVQASAFFFFVVASDHEPDKARLAASGLNVDKFSFGHFWLTILSGFFPIEPQPWGMSAVTASSSIRIDGSETAFMPGKSDPLSYDDIIGYCLDRAGAFGEYLAERLATHYEGELAGKNLELVREALTLVSKTPSDHGV